MEDVAAPLLDTARAVARFGACGEDFDRLSDAQVIEFQQAIAEHQRRLDAVKIHAAGQLARRSRPEFGHSGLAARNGFRSPEAMLQSMTKGSGREASQLLTLGRLLDDAEASTQLVEGGSSQCMSVPAVIPWQAGITRAVTAGVLSVECADAVRRGLGEPTDLVSAEALGRLADRIIADNAELSADRLFKAARLERDLIDLTGIKARQMDLHDRAGLRMFPRPDGMLHLVADVDPEGAALLTAALDPLTSPRHGGPRFVDGTAKIRAQAIVNDPRTTARIALDGLLHLIQLGLEVDPDVIPRRFRPVVKVLTTEKALRHRDGFGIVEDSNERLSVQTCERLLCDGDAVELIISPEGQPLNLGRTRRLFSSGQREALAARDGGCLWPQCQLPPSWSEAHHIEGWHREHGRTDLQDGVLLCRFHH